MASFVLFFALISISVVADDLVSYGSLPIPTPTPTPTPEPWFPIYDPFILGDNCNYESQFNCYEQIIPNIDIVRRYLAVRDAYPTKALKHTRVLALSGITQPVVELFHDSLAAQIERNPAPIDMYFYSDYKLVRYVCYSCCPSHFSFSIHSSFSNCIWRW
ncbi:hypothetical protein JH06_1982 [Blastocystis sp. subtype 4]|uniref:hypothetical protein n=1 Tax=Blastocystis sp. subtype 4 TaxID=944170 RepID=UPI0007117FD5|nr:hypothetical protein JH06_1982 [Blastocystis sp. subtype 4]KNB44327.1 hypothetical protein JH06_1982 [Blastocystis sp. subtype 4]|eukprot:XP_014527770.1 hypothetical protein JH06_1982 [Blastocystis sp. subtype 4]